MYVEVGDCCYDTVIIVTFFSAREKLDCYGCLCIMGKHALQQLNAPLLDVREGGPDRVGDQRLIETSHGGSDVWLRQIVDFKCNTENKPSTILPLTSYT